MNRLFLLTKVRTSKVSFRICYICILLIYFMDSNSPFIAVLISDIIFIVFALGINKENAKYILSGYNTMSKNERENFDIVNYLILFKKYFLILAASSTIVFTILINLLNAKIALIAYSSYLIIMLLWLVFKGNKFKIKQL